MPWPTPGPLQQYTSGHRQLQVSHFTRALDNGQQASLVQFEINSSTGCCSHALPIIHSLVQTVCNTTVTQLGTQKEMLCSEENTGQGESKGKDYCSLSSWVPWNNLISFSGPKCHHCGFKTHLTIVFCFVLFWGVQLTQWAISNYLSSFLTILYNYIDQILEKRKLTKYPKAGYQQR